VPGDAVGRSGCFHPDKKSFILFIKNEISDQLKGVKIDACLFTHNLSTFIHVGTHGGSDMLEDFGGYQDAKTHWKRRVRIQNS
jgi:hypothetical protein